MAHTPQIQSAYLCAPLNPRKLDKFLKKAKDVLKLEQFDAIAFRGMSGALVAPLLAHKLHKTLIMVRKGDGESVRSHSMRNIEGDDAAKRYLIVDDFLASGNTVRDIAREVRYFTGGKAECIGAMLYYHHIDSGDPLVVDKLCATWTYPLGALKFEPYALP